MQVPARRPALSPRAIFEENLKGAIEMFRRNDIRLAEREDVHEVTSPGPRGPSFFHHEKSFLIPAAYAARSAGQPRRSSG